MRFVLPPLQRRALVIYLLTVILPVCSLLALGLHAFDLQRQAVATLEAEKLSTAVEAAIEDAARQAFSVLDHPIAQHRLEFVDGVLEKPRLLASLPAAPPPELLPAYALEATDPAAALSSYERLLSGSRQPALVSSMIARCLARLGRHEEARAAWARLAAEHPQERDLSHRPFGIVGLIQAGRTTGLADRITQGTWDLSADQAEYFLSELAPGVRSVYLERFRAAREIERRFRVPSDLPVGEVRSEVLGAHRVFYRVTPGDRLEMFVGDPDWLASTARQVKAMLGIGGPAGRAVWPYVGAVGVVFVLLSSGAVVLWRDVAREARVNQIRADFVSGVSHELKTPITLVRLYGETLLRHEELPAAQRRDFYRVITRESSRLGRLVDQVLTFGRLERGELRFEIREGDLLTVVSGVLDDYGDWFEHAGFKVRSCLPPSLPPLRFDPAAVQQALVNLLDNAVKYSGDGREIGVQLTSRDREVAVEVQDWGPGIAPAEQSRIFDRFYRVATGTGKGGYGLGLYMVRRIMEAHGGRAEVESEIGAGSRFRLVFPVART